MKIVFYNPQMSPVIGRTLYNYLLGIFSYGKYWYLIQHALKEKQLVVFIDSNGSSLLPKSLSKIVRPRIELFCWCLINRINPFRVVVLTRPSELCKEDVLIGFSINLLDQKSTNLSNLTSIKCIKLFHLTHFIQNISLIAKNSKIAKIDYFMAENNLYKNSPFFRKYFKWYKKDVYTLPFVFQDRFMYKNPHRSRKNSCLAIGTIVDTAAVHADDVFKEFVNFYKTTVLQPIRYEIYRNRKKLTKINSYISELYEIKLKITNASMLRKYINILFNATIATKREYFKFDMVELFNRYSMFINGEEINNLPGIGFVEGMACGCAYFGILDPMYSDIGLISNKHYISYDGTLSDLQMKISYYQNKQEQLTKIAETGYAYVRYNFSGVTVASKLFEDLFQLTLQHTSPKKKHLKCSFISNS